MHRQPQAASDLAPSVAGKQGWPTALAAPGEHSELIAGIVVAVGFCWRLWLAHATFFNTDEAWHFSVANQNSLLAAYKASLTLAHPPLMVFVLYFWRHLGTSNVMLRLPGVLAGTIFCWAFYRWLAVLFGRTVALCGLIFAALLPPMIALSSEVRQYSWMLMFAVAAAYFLEQALAQQSAPLTFLSSLCMWLAILSHYSALLFAATLGVYAILRMLEHRPNSAVVASWGTGQIVGVVIAGFLYKTHIAKLRTVYPGEPLHRFADFYLSNWYYHPGQDDLFRFLWRGTFGIFRFTFGQTAVGQIAAVFFVAGIVLLMRRDKAGTNPSPTRFRAVLLMTPFILNWVAVIAGLYPYGRTRQCIFLAVFGLAGASLALARSVGNRASRAIALSIAIVIFCHVFGTLQGRDMLPLADQRHEHMDRSLQFLRSQVSPSDVIFTDKSTAFQLGHYLCHQKPANIEFSRDGFESFRCDGISVIATGPNDGALMPETFKTKLQDMSRIYALNSQTVVWVVQGGWASRLGETLLAQSPEFSDIELHVYSRYLELFKMTPPKLVPTPSR
jgi:hypothetical protein